MRTCLLVLAGALAGSGSLGAQSPGATINGVVYDSVGRAPLAGATVQLVGGTTPRVASADSLGRYRIDSVPDGKYIIGFFHPALDSLAIEAPLKEVVVERQRGIRADLFIPSPARLRAAICGARADSGGVLIGTIRDVRDGNPVGGAEAVGAWLEITITSRGYVPGRPLRTVKANQNGWFSICNVPTAGQMTLSASRGADSTDVIDIDLPTSGFVRRDLYLGPSRTIVVGDTTRTDTLASPPRRVHLGDVRMSGTVLTSEGTRPVPGAQVGIVNGPRTRTNERGEWTLVDAPGGTRMLEVRAVSYYPIRRAVDVVPGAPPVAVKLATLKAILDTVRVTASRLRGRDISGFLERSHSSGVGKFVTEDQIKRRNPIQISDMFHTIPGLRLDRAALGGNVLTIRGAFGQCAPTFYIDGAPMAPEVVDINDIDGMVRPGDIAGIEIYTSPGVPPQFQAPLADCGSIVIWTK